MHSTVHRGSDFELFVRGRAVSHAEYFQQYDKTSRVAMFVPGRIDGAGAINLFMAFVTAFFEDYRKEGENFFVYPDFFVMQPTGAGELASYLMFDVYPRHKNVGVGPRPVDVLGAVTDRGVDVLLVPDGEAKETDFGELYLASAKRTIKRCYAYAFDGEVRDADLVITCKTHPMLGWVKEMFDSVTGDDEAEQRKRAWLDKFGQGETLVQSYRQISLDEALELL